MIVYLLALSVTALPCPPGLGSRRGRRRCPSDRTSSTAALAPRRRPHSRHSGATSGGRRSQARGTTTTWATAKSVRRRSRRVHLSCRRVRLDAPGPAAASLPRMVNLPDFGRFAGFRGSSPPSDTLANHLRCHGCHHGPLTWYVAQFQAKRVVEVAEALPAWRRSAWRRRHRANQSSRGSRRR